MNDACPGVADRGYALETGRLVVEGVPAQLWDNEEVRAAHRGGRTSAPARLASVTSPP